LTYFKLLNAQRKLRKKAELKPNWEMFWVGNNVEGEKEEGEE